MSTAINLIPEYQNENGVWHPFFPEKGSEIWYQGNMRDSLGRTGWNGDHKGTLVEEKDLTVEEINLLKGTYEYEGCVGVDEETKKPIMKKQTGEFNYIPYTYSITLSELSELVDEALENADEALKDRITDFENALNDVNLAKVALCSGTGKEIPDTFTENLYEARKSLEGFLVDSDYDMLDDYMCLSRHCVTLAAFGQTLPYEDREKVRYLFYVN